ncbi:MAG: hypothetical protein ACRC6B_01310 [Fusobacteriaceae bacterium]
MGIFSLKKNKLKPPKGSVSLSGNEPKTLTISKNLSEVLEKSDSPLKKVVSGGSKLSSTGNGEETTGSLAISGNKKKRGLSAL